MADPLGGLEGIDEGGEVEHHVRARVPRDLEHRVGDGAARHVGVHLDHEGAHLLAVDLAAVVDVEDGEEALHQRHVDLGVLHHLARRVVHVLDRLVAVDHRLEVDLLDPDEGDDQAAAVAADERGEALLDQG